MFEILLRLPANSLVRFKIVCKQWRDLLSHPHFVKSQLKHANKGYNVCCLQLHQPFGIIFRRHANFVTVTSINSEQTELQTRNIDFPSEFLSSDRVLLALGSCNGLLLLITPLEATYLWNPSTRRCKIFTHSDFYPSSGWSDCITGLAYDMSRDECKGVIIQETLLSIRIIVFSSKNGKWKGVDRMTSLPIDSFANVTIKSFMDGNIQGIAVNGAPHWIRIKSFDDNIDDTNRIMYFDVADEKLKVMSIPNIPGGIPITSPLFLLEGCLCILGHEKDGRRFDVWVMKEYGVESSWTKLFAITSASSFMPLGFLTKDDARELVLWHLLDRSNYYERFNVKTRKKTNIDSIDKYNYRKILVSYVETLVSP